MAAHSIITLTTDFGLDDICVGVMKGVNLSINPGCTIVDITHGVEPQDIAAGALALESACQYFPQGAIHVAIVDPGVGGGRRPLVLETNKGLFVGPDNGIFSFALQGPGLKAVYELTAKNYFLPDPSSTFHGRDIFAPAAAHLSKGVQPEQLGRKIDNPIILPSAMPEIHGDILEGRIIRIDRYGNLISNVSRDMLQEFVRESKMRAEVKGATMTKLMPSYAAAQEGELFCIIGSTGRLEVSLKNSSAVKRIGASRGDSIVLKKV